MQTILGTPTPKEIAEAYVEVALREWLKDYRAGSCTLKTTIEQAKGLMHIKQLEGAITQKQLDAFIEQVKSIKVQRHRNSPRSLTPSFYELGQKVVQIFHKEQGLPKTKNNNWVGSAYEAAAKLFRDWGAKPGCTPSMVWNAANPKNKDSKI